MKDKFTYWNHIRVISGEICTCNRQSLVICALHIKGEFDSAFGTEFLTFTFLPKKGNDMLGTNMCSILTLLQSLRHLYVYNTIYGCITA